MFLIEQQLRKIARLVSRSRPVRSEAGYVFPGNSLQIDNLMVLQGRLIATINQQRAPFSTLQEAEFRVFSQFGEDGILQYLVHESGVRREEEVFVEFGVQDYSESNTRFLLINNNWRGLILDGDDRYIQSIKAREYFWRYDLTAQSAWIDKDNIDQIFANAGFSGEVGVLSIDVDGNDYWIWESISVINPIIVVVEWNSLFGPEYPVTVPYNPGFTREDAHYSHLYWGASISALAHLGERKGYVLVGSNNAGNNLFFVRNDRVGRLKSIKSGEAYVESRFRESRDLGGRLNFLDAKRRRNEIRDMPLTNVLTGEMTSLRSLDSMENFSPE